MTWVWCSNYNLVASFFTLLSALRGGNCTPNWSSQEHRASSLPQLAVAGVCIQFSPCSLTTSWQTGFWVGVDKAGSLSSLLPLLVQQRLYSSKASQEFRASVVLALNYDSGFTVGEPSQKRLEATVPSCQVPSS